jgi:hypothetical protein
MFMFQVNENSLLVAAPKIHGLYFFIIIIFDLFIKRTRINYMSTYMTKIRLHNQTWIFYHLTQLHLNNLTKHLRRKYKPSGWITFTAALGKLSPRN